jgi:hypothetical protein
MTVSPLATGDDAAGEAGDCLRVAVGFGRIVVSEIEVLNLSVILV